MNDANSFKWTPEAIQKITTMWQAGSSASLIAGALGPGVSRSAVLGKLNRLKLLGTRGKTTNQLAYRRASRSVKGAGALREARERTRKARSEPDLPKSRKAGSGSSTRISLKADQSFQEPAPVVFDATLAKPWTERRFGECAYPISGEGAETFSCCQPCGDATYCKGHQRIMYDRRPQTLARYKSMQRWAGKVA